MQRSRVVWDLSYLIVGAAIATGLAWPIYQSARMIVVAIAATVLGSAVVLIGRRLRWPALFIGIAAVLVYLLAIVPLAIPSAATSPLRFLRGIGDGVVGVIVGWKQLLTLTLPVGEYQAVLVPLFVVFFLGSLGATAMLLSDRRWSLFVVPVIVAMSSFGLIFGSSETGDPLVLGPIIIPAPREVLLGTAVLLASLLWLIGRARMARARALRIAQARTEGVQQGKQSIWLSARRQALAVVLVGLAIAGGLAIAPVVADVVPRQALRDEVDPLIIVQQQASPLSAYRTWFSEENYDEVLFRLEGELDGIDRVRIATLADFDGEVFRVGSPTGELQFTRMPQSVAATGSRSITVSIGDGYSGVWLPVPGMVEASPTFTGPRAEELADAFYVSRSDASAIDVAPLADDQYGVTAGDSYRVSVVVGAEAATIDGAQGQDPLIESEDYPELVDWVELQEVPRTGDGLVELIERLRERGYLSHSLVDSDGAETWIAALAAQSPYVFQASYSGHSIARIESLFGTLVDQQVAAGVNPEPELLVASVGDDEQFATAAALLARYFGFPSRVVLGAVLEADEPAPSVPACVDGECTGANMTAWVEVQAANGEWAALTASPQFEMIPADVVEGEQLPENPTVPQTSKSDALDPPPAQRDDSEGSSLEATEEPGWLLALLAVLAVVGTGGLIVLLLLLPLLVLLFLKSLRRRGRRNSPVPEVSIVGAWDELVDSYVDYGVDLPANATRVAIATAVGRPPALSLAHAVDAAVFAQHPPRKETRLLAWAMVDAERRAVSGSATLMQRIRAAASLASFVRFLNPRAVVGAGLSVLKRKETAQ